MKAQSLSLPIPESSSRRAAQFGFAGLLLLALLLFWYGTAITVFARNSYQLAFWFVLTQLLLPLTTFSIGWLASTLVSYTSVRSFVKLMGTHACLLILACAVLPIPLIAINLLPLGRSTSTWHGRVTKYEQIRVQNGWRGQSATVTADSLGPLLHFGITRADYLALEATKANGDSLEVNGEVIRGFLGVPVAVRLNPIKSQTE